MSSCNHLWFQICTNYNKFGWILHISYLMLKFHTMLQQACMIYVTSCNINFDKILGKLWILKTMKVILYDLILHNIDICHIHLLVCGFYWECCRRHGYWWLRGPISCNNCLKKANIFELLHLTHSPTNKKTERNLDEIQQTHNLISTYMNTESADQNLHHISFQRKSKDMS